MRSCSLFFSGAFGNSSLGMQFSQSFFRARLDEFSHSICGGTEKRLSKATPQNTSIVWENGGQNKVATSCHTVALAEVSQKSRCSKVLLKSKNKRYLANTQYDKECEYGKECENNKNAIKDSWISLFAKIVESKHRFCSQFHSILTNTLKPLIIGAIIMTTQANAQNTKSTTTLTHTQIKGVQIPVIYEYSALIPAGNIQLVFQGGGSINSDKIALTALKDEILSLGSSKKGNVGFANALEEKAISLSASSGSQTLNFYLSFLKEYQKDAIDLLGELIHHPNLKEISKAKTALNARILSNKSDFDYLASELLNKQLFAGTPLANPSLGTQKDVEAISKKDIKASLDSTLNLSNAIIVVGGDIELESTLKMLESILQDLPNGEPYTKKHFEVSAKPSFVSENAPTQQAYIYFGSPLKMQNLKEERYLARVAGFILGASGFGSRLMEEVRVKRGLAYGAYFRYATSSLISYGIGQLQTKLESQDEAIKVVREVISDFVKNGATQKELDDAKKFLLGSEPLGNETLSQRLGRSFNEYFLGLEIGFYKHDLERIKNLELKTLNAYIKSHPEIAELTFGVITQESSKEPNSQGESKQKSHSNAKKAKDTATKSSKKQKG